MFMSLIKGDVGEGAGAAVSWSPRANMGDVHPAGEVAVGGELTFVLTRAPMDGVGVLACDGIDLPKGDALLRVDEVCFPIGAVAHRHTHAGSGIRHLVRGSLRIEAEGHTQIMNAGDCWFEPAGSPVRAVALQDRGVTSFLRAMVIPAAYAGKSTFALADPSDAELPRLQVTHRHIDLPFQVDAG